MRLFLALVLAGAMVAGGGVATAGDRCHGHAAPVKVVKPVAFVQPVAVVAPVVLVAQPVFVVPSAPTVAIVAQPFVIGGGYGYGSGVSGVRRR